MIRPEHPTLRGILDNDHAVLRGIYRDGFAAVERFVKKNKGTTEDARDLFQEGIVFVFRKLQRGEVIQLTADFTHYLFGVCRMRWFNKLRKKTPVGVTDETNITSVEENDYAEEFLSARKWRLFQRKMTDLTEECRRVLDMLFNGRTGREIARALDYTEDYAKRKKYRCKRTLIELVRADPEFIQLTHDPQ